MNSLFIAIGNGWVRPEKIVAVVKSWEDIRTRVFLEGGFIVESNKDEDDLVDYILEQELKRDMESEVPEEEESKA